MAVWLHDDCGGFGVGVVVVRIRLSLKEKRIFLILGFWMLVTFGIGLFRGRKAD